MASRAVAGLGVVAAAFQPLAPGHGQDRLDGGAQFDSSASPHRS
ncbi:hypothetical protein ACPPVQ_02695 [Diaminobutyricibacter sp. McL0618]